MSNVANSSLCVASPEQMNSHSSDASYHGEQGYNYQLWLLMKIWESVIFFQCKIHLLSVCLSLDNNSYFRKVWCFKSKVGVSFWVYLTCGIRFLLKNVWFLGPNKDCPAQLKVPKRAGNISQCVIACYKPYTLIKKSWITKRVPSHRVAKAST